MSDSGFPYDADRVIGTLATVFREQGDQRTADLLASAVGRIEQNGYDNWDGGSRLYDEPRRQRTTAQVDALLHRLQGRLSAKDYQWALENSGQEEWGLAVTTIREAIHLSELTLSDDEAQELSQIESQLRFKW